MPSEGNVHATAKGNETKPEMQEGRWIEAVIVIEDVVMFWRDFFKQYRPQEKLPQPRNPFTVMPD
jgi:hypothetical protein